jgi:protoporphyrinogen oxidase
MSTSWIAGRVPNAPLEDVLRASFGSTTEGYTHQSVFRYPLRGGFADMHERIARPVRDRVVTEHRVQSIERARGEGWLVDGERFDKVVSTIPLHVLPDVMESMDDDAAAALWATSEDLVGFSWGV